MRKRKNFFMNKSKRLLCALFIASTIVLGIIISIRTIIITIGFSFVSIMLEAVILRPKYSIFIVTISDIIGSLLYPTGSYFFGFTITAFLVGLTYGILLYRKEFKIDRSFIIRLTISTIIVTGILNGLLNTVWIVMINKNASKIVLPIRIIKQLIMVPIKVFTMIGLCKIFEERIKKLVND